jgi:DNA polymerase III delta subunit|tara:strand:+ start:327 stop:1295 length:969 start_codon:yes stop_codon:yes gene_type:complete
MPESSIDINKFLELNEFSNSKFLIFGEEPSLVVKVKNHALAKEDLRMIEKVYLKMEQEDFEQNFHQAVLSNSLFNEKKAVFINLDKNRLNKGLIQAFQTISEANTNNLIFIEVKSISKKTILKDVVPIFESSAHIVECSMTYDSNVKDFLKANLPKIINDEKNINNLINMYEGNFSLLINDLEILKVLDLKNEEDILNVFNDNGIRKSSRLIEHVSKRETKKALEILESMKSNDRNSIGLLIWVLARDCQALSSLKESKTNLRSFNIWDSQVKWYNALSKRVSVRQIKESISNLDKADKSLKGIIDADPWTKAKDVVLELSA